MKTVPSSTKEYRRKQMRAWRWRQKHLSADERADHAALARTIAARRRWDTRGRLSADELRARRNARNRALFAGDPQRAERRRAYMRDYYRRKPWAWDGSRANRKRHRGQTVRLGDHDCLVTA